MARVELHRCSFTWVTARAFHQLEQPPERFQDLIDAGLVLRGLPATVPEQAVEQLRAAP